MPDEKIEPKPSFSSLQRNYSDGLLAYGEVRRLRNARQMTGFKPWHSYGDFERAIKRTARFIHGSDVQSFLRAVLATSRKRTRTIEPNGSLWRAQIGYSLKPYYQDGDYVDDMPAPHPPDRMVPLRDRATEGRANPKGIPYLYLATKRDTALSEVRPWIGSLITVGQFRIKRRLKLINCTVGNPQEWLSLESEMSPKQREETVWAQIDRAFASPVTRSDDSADYVPTQVLAEFFRANGFDGIGYRSSLGAGHNIVLFDIEAVELTTCLLFELHSMKFEFRQALTPYFMRRDHRPKGADHPPRRMRARK